MQNLFETLGTLIGTHWKPRSRADRHSRTFSCRCDSQIFFSNTDCRICKAPLGYLPLEGKMVALDPGEQSGTWLAYGRQSLYKSCGNRELAAQCNWMMAADDENPLCIACRLNRTIPDLDDAANARYWGAIEVAKRRLVSQLLALGIPVRSKVDEDLERGLMFDFLRSPAKGPRVMTGHAAGLIQLNVEEADDAKREAVRLEMRESYRTLLGHLRHEVGHYYWDRLVRDSQWLDPFRELFGDERTDYAAALKANYEHGPGAGWAERYISAYASIHPWEDWAETWAHYLHVVDSLGTAMGFGLSASGLERAGEPFGRDALYAPDDEDAERFLSLLNSWIEMTMVLNEMARSLGQPDFYPFVLPRPVVGKLQFVYLVVRDVRRGAGRSRRSAAAEA